MYDIELMCHEEETFEQRSYFVKLDGIKSTDPFVGEWTEARVVACCEGFVCPMGINWFKLSSKDYSELYSYMVANITITSRSGDILARIQKSLGPAQA